MRLIGLALSAVIAALHPPSELVVLFPEPVENGDEAALDDAWQAVIEEFRSSAKRLGVSMTVQNQAVSILKGDARQRAKECGSNTRCLILLGETFDAAYLVLPQVAKDGVLVTLIDIAAKHRYAPLRSVKRLETKPVKNRARAAAQGLIASCLRLFRRTPTPAAARVLEAAPHETQKPKPSESESTEPESLPTHPLPPPLIPAAPAETPATQFLPAPPNNRLIAVQESEPQPDRADEDTQPWWVWGAIGLAVAVGASTALWLTAGAKGGPSVDSQIGAITGSY